MKKLLLVDGNSILNRAFYALSGSRMLKTRSGMYTNAVYGFLNVLNKYLQDPGYTHMAIAFDRKEPTFRHEMFDGYKATRSKMPDELAEQMPIAKELIENLGIRIIEQPGIEADDIIGTFAKNAARDGFEVIVLSGDKDLFQLIDERITVDYATTKDKSSVTVSYQTNEMLQRYGIRPESLVELKAIMGDPSDNIPGVKGIGEKGAIKLITEFGNIDKIYDKIDSIDNARTKKLLEESKEMCFLSRELARIKTDATLPLLVDDLKKQEPDLEKLYDILTMLEFNSFLESFGISKKAETKKSKKAAIIINDEKGVLNFLQSSQSEKIYIYFDSKKISGSYRLFNILLMIDDEKIYHVSGESFLHELINKSSFKMICVYDSKAFFSFLNKTGAATQAKIFDVSIAAYLLDPDSKFDSIDDIYLKYFAKHIECDQGAGNEQLDLFVSAVNETKEVETRCVYAESLKELQTLLDAELEKNDMKSLFYDIEIPVSAVLAKMEAAGVRVDKDVLLLLDARLTKKLTELDSDIKRIAGEEFNLNSPKQLGEILFDKLRLPVIKKTKTGYSTNAEVLEMLRGRHDIIDYILSYRQLEKLRGTYSAGLLAQIAPDGRIYTTLNQKVTSTGRLSSQDPNLQNIPIKLEQGREFRKAFVADEGSVLIDADYSQIELRVLAHFSKDEVMRDVYQKDEDIHTMTASYIFDQHDVDKITPQMRNSAKTVNFSVIYGISAYSLSIDLGITRKEAQKYIDEYFEKYKGVKEYMQSAVEYARTNGHVKTLFNRKRYLNEINSSNFNIRSFWERTAMNTPIQGTAADIIKLAMIKVDKALTQSGSKARLILQIHDELLIDCPVDEKDEVMILVKEAMQDACRLDVPLKADIKYGDSWYAAK